MPQLPAESPNIQTKTQQPEEKQRFALKLPEDLLQELREESLQAEMSVTALIERAVRNRHKNAFTTEEHQAKAMRLCPVCAEVFKAYSQGKPAEFTTKILRAYLWGKLGFWEHGKFEDGCPGWQDEARPEQIKRVRDELEAAIFSVSV